MFSSWVRILIPDPGGLPYCGSGSISPYQIMTLESNYGSVLINVPFLNKSSVFIKKSFILTFRQGKEKAGSGTGSGSVFRFEARSGSVENGFGSKTLTKYNLQFFWDGKKRLTKIKKPIPEIKCP